MIFGFVEGTLLAWLGALVGACILFFLSKSVARDFFVERLRNKYDFDLQNMDQRHVFWILFICRAFPIVPTTLINVGSAISGVSNLVFISSSALGKLPWAIVYVCLGNYFMESRDITGTLTIIGAIFLISFIGMGYFRRRIPIRRRSR